MYLSHLCVAAAWHHIYSVLSNPDSFYEDLLEDKTNSKDVSTLVSTVVFIRVWFSGKFSNLLPHFFLHHFLITQTKEEEALQKCTPPLHSVSTELINQ